MEGEGTRIFEKLKEFWQKQDLQKDKAAEDFQISKSTVYFN